MGKVGIFTVIVCASLKLSADSAGIVTSLLPDSMPGSTTYGCRNENRIQEQFGCPKVQKVWGSIVAESNRADGASGAT